MCVLIRKECHGVQYRGPVVGKWVWEGTYVACLRLTCNKADGMYVLSMFITMKHLPKAFFGGNAQNSVLVSY